MEGNRVNFILQKKNQVLFSDESSSQLLKKWIHSEIELDALNRPKVIVCIGSDRSTGDSLGPLVGRALAFKNQNNVFGTLERPVHALNVFETLDYISRNFVNPYIIAIDACLGQLSNVGMIQAMRGPVLPGAGVNKQLPPIGDFHINGVVNVSGHREYSVLQSTRLYLVSRMADVIADSLMDLL
jgi:putative sporulation protein YyaC